MLFKELHFALVSFCGLARFERTQIAPFAGLSAFLPGIEPVFTGFQFSNHSSPSFPRKPWPRVCALKEDPLFFPVQLDGKRLVLPSPVDKVS
jgi:hypothetical protein